MKKYVRLTGHIKNLGLAKKYIDAIELNALNRRVSRDVVDLL